MFSKYRREPSLRQGRRFEMGACWRFDEAYSAVFDDQQLRLKKRLREALITR